MQGRLAQARGRGRFGRDSGVIDLNIWVQDDGDTSTRGRLPPFGRVAVVALLLTTAGCMGKMGFAPISTTSTHGYVISDTALAQVPVGSSRDQVLIALGSPSTTGNYGGEVYYYISQTRRQGAEFMKSKVVDQRVLAIYFEKNSKVGRIAEYGKKDGKVFDFVSRTTPTGGRDETFIQQIFAGVVGLGHNPLNH